MSETHVFLAVTDQDDGRGWSEERERERGCAWSERVRSTTGFRLFQFQFIYSQPIRPSALESSSRSTTGFRLTREWERWMWQVGVAVGRKGRIYVTQFALDKVAVLAARSQPHPSSHS